MAVNVKLAKKAAGKAARHRTPQEQAALEAARAAGIPGFRSPNTPAAQVAAQQGISPSTGLRPGLNPNVAQTGTFRGKNLGRQGRVTLDMIPALGLNKKQQQALREVLGKSKRQRDEEDRKLLEQARAKARELNLRPSDTRAYGAEQGIYGPGGYEGWINKWYNSPQAKKFWQAFGGPMSPEEWADYIGYSDSWTIKPDEARAMKKKYGNVPRLAGSMPWDYVPNLTDEKRRSMGVLPEERRVKIFNAVYGTNFKNWADVERELGPARLWQGIDTARRLRSNEGIDWSRVMDTPRYVRDSQLLGMDQADVGWQGAFNAIFGRGPGGLQRAREMLERAQEQTPEWFRNAYQGLLERAQGVDPGFISSALRTFLGSPGMNITDPSKPLFGGGGLAGGAADIIASSELAQAAGLSPQLADFGLNALGYLRTLSAEEFVRDVLPLWLQYHAVDPQTGERMFPDVVARGLDPTRTKEPGGPGTYERGLLADLPSYQRYMAYGMPGNIYLGPGNPRPGVYEGGVVPPGGFRPSYTGGFRYYKDLLNNQIDIYLPPGMTELPPEIRLALSSSTAPQQYSMWLAAYMNDPNIYWQNSPYREFAPDRLTPEELARLRAVQASTRGV